MGWPKDVPVTLERLGSMTDARTIMMIKPKNQQEPIDIRIPKGY